MTATDRAPVFAPALVGALAAVYLLSGRWALSRLAGDYSAPIHLEVRVWVVGLLAATAFLANVWPTRSPARLVAALVVAFLAWMSVAALWAPDASLAGYKAYELLLVAVATVSLARVLASDAGPRALWWMWGTILVLAGLLAGIALPGVLASGAADDRLAVLAGGPNVFARIMGFLAIAALFFWRSYGRAWLWMPIVVLAFVLVLLTGSRGGLLSVAVGVAAFLALVVRDLRRLVPAAILAGGLFVGAVNFTAPGRAALDAYDRRVKILLLTDRYTSGRTQLYRSAYELGQTAPITGRGLAAFPAKGLGVYPHNLFLEAFCEGGILGLALLLLALGTGAVAALRGRDAAAAAGFAMLLVASQFSGDLYDARGVFALLVLASAPAGAAAEQRDGADEGAEVAAPGR